MVGQFCRLELDDQNCQLSKNPVRKYCTWVQALKLQKVMMSKIIKETTKFTVDFFPGISIPIR